MKRPKEQPGGRPRCSRSPASVSPTVALGLSRSHLRLHGPQARAPATPLARYSRAPSPGGIPKPAAQKFTRRLHGNGLSAPTPARPGYAPNNKARSHWLRCRLRQPISEGARAARPPAGYLEPCWRCPTWFGAAWRTVVTVPEPWLRSSSCCGLERQLAVRLPAPPLVILGKRRAWCVGPSGR